ncbi:MAG: hypothetical protein GY796_20960 [Chloroflexi bacterium]|nr:hypothetical protein [Chloroflexota bacterium]
MAIDEVTRLLEEGVAAVKNGRHDEARQLLLQVLEADEENESAWLWLSSVVESDDEKRICLENALTLNPGNVVAQKGLAKLESSAELVETAVNQPASIQAPKISYQQYESTNDVWSRNVPLCGYCAGEIAADDTRCPHCRRSLIVNLYRYPQPSVDLTGFWVMLVGVAQTFFIQMMYTIVVEQSTLAALTGLLTAVLLMGLAVGVYFRQFWAYLTAVVILILIIFAIIVRFLALPDLSALGFDALDPTIQGVVAPLTSSVWIVLKIIQIVTSLLALFFAFKAAPDFERVRYKQTAVLTKGLAQASDYHIAARRLSDNGLWASAVINWQQAAALEPTRYTFQRHLGEAYARLGFYGRSLDVLQAARLLVPRPDMQTELDDLIQSIQQQAKTTNP